MSGTHFCADPWREADEDMKMFFSGEGRDAWSEALAEQGCVSTAYYHSCVREKGSWTFENKHPALRRYLFCAASFSSKGKIISRSFQNLPVVGRGTHSRAAFAVGCWSSIPLQPSRRHPSFCLSSSICVHVRAP